MKYLFICLFLFSAATFAFNGRKCDTLIGRKGGFYYLPLSTAQFTSSTGACSAIGKTKEEERQLFYAVNWEFIQNDVAKGNGENLDALIKLSGCKRNSNSNLQRKLKDRYQYIFVNDVERSYNNIYPILDGYCKGSPQA